MSTDILPLLQEITVIGQQHVGTGKGQASENVLLKTLNAACGSPITNPDDVPRLINVNGAFSTASLRRYIRLADTNEGNRTISPLIYLDGNLSGKFPLLRLQVLIVTHAQGDQIPNCLLLRFETPEGGSTAGFGVHDFYHSQICSVFRSGAAQEFSVENIGWKTESCPAWPMDARNPLQLLACLLFALYGKLEGLRLLRRVYPDDFEVILEGMHLFPPPNKPPQPPTKSSKRTARRSKRSKLRRA